eukprot:6369346-Heterocapsa_arctica.AAC.1
MNGPWAPATSAINPVRSRACRWPARGVQNPGGPEGGPGSLPRPAGPGRPCQRKNGRPGPAQPQ